MKKKILIFIVVSILIILFITPIIIYKQMFDKRFDTPLCQVNLNEIFEVKKDKYEFTSNKNQKLIGYNYYYTKKPKGIIIFSHGLGGGHKSNLPIINYLAKNNYYIFAYDATACDESEGKIFGGVNQSVIDLENAINFVKNEADFKNLPIFLFGHSMGGYATMSVLNKPIDVKGVVSVSGFNKLTDMIQSTIGEDIGILSNMMIPPIMLYETLKFKDYATFTSEKGIKNSKTKLFIIHSEDDELVNKKLSYDVYKNLYETEYKNTDKIKFKLFKDKGHNYIFYKKEVFDDIKEFYRNEYKKYEENKNYINNFYENDFIKNSVWFNGIDNNFLDEILDFYNNILENEVK